MAYCRVREIKSLPVDEVLWMLKHHLRQAVHTYEHLMDRGVVLYAPCDNLNKVADMISRQPKLLRDRLDAVFAGVAILGGGRSEYECEFEDIELQWNENIQNIFAHTNRAPSERVALCKELAYSFRPRYEDYFQRLLGYVHGGGLMSEKIILQ